VKKMMLVGEDVVDCGVITAFLEVKPKLLSRFRFEHNFCEFKLTTLSA
jgi:hypothetical protein